MKRLFFVLPAALFALCVVSCAPSHRQTIAHLKAAIDGETIASARYAAFSHRAAEEGYPEIAALFAATARAEVVHLTRHMAALEQLGEPGYITAKPELEVHSTLENLQTAIDGETYDYTVVYPVFLADADREKAHEAALSFSYALEAERAHSKLLIEAMEQLRKGGQLPAVYYTCPGRGYVYAEAPVPVCKLCGTTSDKFIVFTAEEQQVPL